MNEWMTEWAEEKKLFNYERRNLISTHKKAAHI